MDYKTLRVWFMHKDAVFNGFNGADGTTTDNSTDPIITRNPNDFLVPRIDGSQLFRIAVTIAAISAAVILVPIAIKTLKNI